MKPQWAVVKLVLDREYEGIDLEGYSQYREISYLNVEKIYKTERGAHACAQRIGGGVIPWYGQVR